ncbi:MAG: peptidylprolyl isomerase [Actinomycetia bacterium]|nr:peptidylprolyl isomerase [Actinomycetes bacterium]
MHIKKILAVAAASVVLVAACSSEESVPPTTEPAAPPTTEAISTTAPASSVPADYADYRNQPTACGAEKPDPVDAMQFDEPGDAALVGTTVVTLDTSCGPIVIELGPDIAPETTNSFAFLAESGYFDGSVSHRIIPGFMMQAGDPTATGLGGPGYTLADEFPSGAAPYTRGTVAMANAGPGTTGSQFFIMFQDVDWLGPQYTIIGEVTSGLETLELIAAVPLGKSPNSPDPSPSTPLESVYILSASVQR